MKEPRIWVASPEVVKTLTWRLDALGVPLGLGVLRQCRVVFMESARCMAKTLAAV